MATMVAEAPPLAPRGALGRAGARLGQEPRARAGRPWSTARARTQAGARRNLPSHLPMHNVHWPYVHLHKSAQMTQSEYSRVYK